MANYKITIVENNIYDVFVDADSLEEALDNAHSVPHSRWFKDVNASTSELGSDHYVWDSASRKWVQAQEGVK